MYRVHKIKLDPTQEQAIYFAKACGVARFAFNWALAAWQEEYKLVLDIERGDESLHVVAVGIEAFEMLGTDPYAATRRAIVRAAAEIGKAMP